MWIHVVWSSKTLCSSHDSSTIQSCQCQQEKQIARVPGPRVDWLCFYCTGIIGERPLFMVLLVLHDQDIADPYSELRVSCTQIERSQSESSNLVGLLYMCRCITGSYITSSLGTYREMNLKMTKHWRLLHQLLFVNNCFSKCRLTKVPARPKHALHAPRYDTIMCSI